MAHLSAETTALRTSSRKSTVVLTAYTKWTRQSDAKEAGVSAVEP
jgi:AmiR/NasT family two-component response regulator